MNEAELLDKQALVSLREAIGDKVGHIISVYLDETPKSIQTARAAVERADYASARIISHSLKSSSASLGAMRVAQLATELDQKLSNKDFNSIAQDLSNLQQAFDQTRPLFNQFL